MNFQKPFLGAEVDWSHPLADGLEALWMINEGTGFTLHDVTGKGNNAVFKGGLNDADRVAGFHGEALRFDDSGNWAEAPDNDRLGNMTELTLIAIALATGAGGAGGGRIIHKRIGAGDESYYLGQVTSGPDELPKFRIEAAAFNDITGTTNLKSDNAHVIVGTWRSSDGDQRLYVNGKEEANGTETGTLATSVEIGIGRHVGSTTRNFTGLIFMAGIYRRRFDAAKVEWLSAEPFAMIAEPDPQRTFFIGVVDNTAKNKRRSAFSPLPVLTLPPVPDGVID